MNQNIFVLVLSIPLMVIAGDFLARAIGLRAQYRMAVGTIAGYFRRQAGSFIAWAWRKYKQFIIGVVAGALLALFFMGHLV